MQLVRIRMICCSISNVRLPVVIVYNCDFSFVSSNIVDNIIILYRNIILYYVVIILLFSLCRTTRRRITWANNCRRIPEARINVRRRRKRRTSTYACTAPKRFPAWKHCNSISRPNTVSTKPQSRYPQCGLAELSDSGEFSTRDIADKSHPYVFLF